MNGRSHPIHENRRVEVSPPQGASVARRAVRCFQISFPPWIRRWGFLPWVGGSGAPIVLSERIQFNMEMPQVFSSFVPVALGHHVCFHRKTLSEKRSSPLRHPRGSETVAKPGVPGAGHGVYPSGPGGTRAVL